MKKLVLLFSIPVFFIHSSIAQQNWDGDNAAGNFSFADNWYNDLLPAWSSTTDLTFQYRNNLSQTSLLLDLGWKPVRSILFASTFVNSMPLNSNASSGLDFYYKIENYSPVLQTINIPLSFKGTVMEINPVNGDLTFNNLIYNNNKQNINVYGNSAKLVTFNNYIEGDNTVSFTIQHLNYSKVAIGYSNAASFSGGVNIHSGELWIKAGAAINGGILKVGNGSTSTCKLYISDPSITTTVQNDIVIPGNSANSFIGGLNTSNTHFYSGDINLLGDVNLDAVNPGGTINFSGKISGSGGITKINPGTVIISGGALNNTFSGGTTVLTGTLVLNKVAGFRVLGSGSTLINNGATLRTNTPNQWGTATVPALITINGNGILNLNNNDQKIGLTSTSPAAMLNLGFATVNIDRNTSNSFAGIISGTGNIIKTNTGKWALTGASTFTGLTTITDGAIQLNHIGGNTIPINNSVTINGTGILQISENQTIDNLTMSAGTLLIDAGKTLTITGAYNVSGGTINNAGTIKLAGGAMAFPGTGATVNNGTANTMANVEIAGNGTVTLTSSFIVSNDIILTSGELDASPANHTITVGNNWTNNGATFTPRNNTVFFNGSGPQLINGSAALQTFNNITVVKSSGALSLSGSTVALAVNGNMNISSGALTGSANTFLIGGNWFNYANTGFNEQTSTVDFNGNGAQTITTAGGEIFYSLKKSGLGTTTLGSAVNIQGGGSAALNISSGTLDAGTYSVGSASAALIMSGGLLKLASLGSTLPEFTTANYTLSGGATIELNGVGAQVLRGARNYQNIIFSNTGIKTISTGIANITGTVSIADATTLDISNNTFGNIATNLTMASGRLRISGTGTKPEIDGNYNLSGNSVIEFYNSGTVANETIKGKNGASADILYNQIEITGNKVGNSSSNITLKANGFFTVKSGGVFSINDNSIAAATATTGQTVIVENNGTFLCGNNQGFNGFAPTLLSNSSVHANITNISLVTGLPGSIVNYAKPGDQPITNANGLVYSNLVLSGTGVKTAPGGNLTINGNLSKTSSVTFNPNNGRVLFNNLSAIQTILSASATDFIFYDISNGNTSVAGLTIGSDIGIIHTLDLLANSNLSLNTPDITLLSGPTSTARVSSIPSTATIAYGGTGRFIVERYFPASRAWRLVTSPLSSNATPATIFSQWQNNGVYKQGIGAFVSGPNPNTSINGLDNSFFNNYSLMAFQNNNYVPVANTLTPLSNSTLSAANIGYYMFVRGDRSRSPDNTVYPNTNNTTLSGTGKLQVGTQIFPCFTRAAIGARYFTLIGNPYASPVDFNSLTRVNLLKRFVVWDPKINQVGAFVYVDDPLNTGSYTVFPASPGGQDLNIQSGQAFFVETDVNPGPSSISFYESSKSSSNNTGMFRPVSPANVNPSFRSSLYLLDAGSSSILADGNLAEFNDDFNDSVDIQDALKFTNVNENFGLIRYGSSLAVERRPIIRKEDTLYFNLTRTTPRNYQFRFQPTNLDSLLCAFLEDNYNGIKIQLKINSLSIYDFTVESNAASYAANRFRIVFKLSDGGQLPFAYTGIRALQRERGIMIAWETENEKNIKNYEVEKSADGANFKKINELVAKGGNKNSTSYYWLDGIPVEGDNYYRIRGNDKSGKAIYSSMVVVKINIGATGLSIHTNPVTNGVIGIEFKNRKVGFYQVKLINTIGQTILSKTINHASGTTIEYIKADDKLLPGIYQLELIASDKETTMVKVMVR